MSKPFIPWPYQKLASEFLYETPRACLFADVGLGKTPTTLTVLDNLQLSGYETKPALIVAPLRVARKVWIEEPKKWDHLKHFDVIRLTGEKSERIANLRIDAPAFSINYDNIPWLIEHLEGKWPFGMVVPDESTRLSGLRMSIRVKNGKRWVQGQGTLRARRMAKMAFQNRDQRWLNLSGTPSPNGLKKLYGQLWFVDFGQRLGNSFEAFKNRFFTIGYDGFKLEPRPGSDKLIHGLIKDVCMSVRAEDWFDLEEPINIPIRVELPKKAREMYQEMKRKLYLKFGTREVEAVNAGSKAVKLLQLASGAIYLDNECESDEDPRSKDFIEIHDEKLAALEGIIEESGGMPLIVAYQFKSDLARLKKYFPKGRDLVTEKDENDFKAGKIDLLFAHPASCGHGIDGFQNVTNRIVFFSQWPDMELRDQIIGRVGPVRQKQAGFNRPVYIYDIIAADTRDEEVIASHGEKTEIQDFLLEAVRR